jgi:Flp pilus assembly protein TadG
MQISNQTCPIQYPPSTFRNFVRNDHGNVAMIFGLASIILAAIVGSAVDYGRWVSAQRQTQYAIDTSVLAASRHAQLTGKSDESIAVAKSYYQKMKPSTVSDTVDFIPGSAANEFKVSGGSEVKTPFLSLIGMSSLPIKPKAAAEVTLGGSGSSDVEISLMLDLTGSMCEPGQSSCITSTKVDALKLAAKDLINIVVQDDQSKIKSRVAIVPFNTRIRVGADGSDAGAEMMKKLTDLDRDFTGYKVEAECITRQWNPGTASVPGNNEVGSGGGWWDCTAYGPPSYPDVNLKINPCVTDRFVQSQWNYWVDSGTADAQWDLSDDQPGSNYWLNSGDGTRMPKSETSSDITPPKGTGKTSGGRPDRNPDDAWRNWNYSSDGSCWGVPNGNIVMPLSADKAALKSRIDGLAAWGATAGPMATQWAWYMLSPKWKNIWTGDSEPAPYSDLQPGPSGQPKVKKIAVLMTDGVYNTFRGWDQQPGGRMSNYAQKVCREMKAKGIVVYTVGFGLSELPAADQALATTTLQECSTSHQIENGRWVYNFYNAETTDALQGAFRDIGQQLVKLRLTE